MRSLAALVLGLVSGSVVAAGDDGPTAPVNCPYCGGEEERMERAGVVSHGPFVFAQSDTTTVEGVVPTADIYWLESEHFRFGLGIGGYKLTQAERKGVREELTRLAEVLPEVRPKTRTLDPWLRVHLYAQRFEEAYDKFLDVMMVEESQFPPRPGIWERNTPYWGEGPYLGEPDKFEVLVLYNDDQQVDYLTSQFGLQIRNTQRWNILPRGALTVATNLVNGELRRDAKLHAHLVFSLANNFIKGFKYYAYETPLWINEGLAHWFERELNPRYNSFSADEGSRMDLFQSGDWDAEAAELVRRGKAPRVAELVGLRNYAEFENEHHVACWSMVTFLIEEHPVGFARLNAALHGRKGPDGLPDGTNMAGVLREAFRRELGTSYQALDEAWRAWALER